VSLCINDKETNENEKKERYVPYPHKHNTLFA
jgi:hypothetical protein